MNEPLGPYSDRAALVTGASQGIGYTIARALGNEGFGVTINSRRPEKLEAAATQLRAEGLDVHAEPGNVADEADIKRVVAAHHGRFGRLDVLVNNAGLAIGALIEDAVTKRIDTQLDVNLRGVYLMLRECIPMLKEAGQEHRKALVVNVASLAGTQGDAWLSVYSASKAGVIALSQAAHKELAGAGVHVSSLCPGFVATPMTDFKEGEILKKDMIQPEDLAEGVLFLLRTSPACTVPQMKFIRPEDAP